MTDWLDDVKIKYYKKNKILFSRDSTDLQDLLKLMRKQKHRTLVMWSLECSSDAVNTLISNYPNDTRIKEAITLCTLWSQGKVKMPIAKKALLGAHALAKDITDKSDIALCHAVGQACATIHVETHAIGLPIYELTSIVYKYGINNCENKIEERINYYIDKLLECEKNIDKNKTWTPFLLDDTKPNKEELLFQKSK